MLSNHTSQPTPHPLLTHDTLEAAIATYLFDPASPPLTTLAASIHIPVFDFLRALAAHPHLPHLIAAATSLRLAAARATALAVLTSTASDPATPTPQRRSAAREILRSSSPLRSQKGVGSGGGRGWTASSPSSSPHALGGPGVPPGTPLPSSSPSPATPPSPLDFSIDPNAPSPLSDSQVAHPTNLVDSLIVKRHQPRQNMPIVPPRSSAQGRSRCEHTPRAADSASPSPAPAASSPSLPSARTAESTGPALAPT